jgi:hypothetical protein
MLKCNTDTDMFLFRGTSDKKKYVYYILETMEFVYVTIVSGLEC